MDAEFITNCDALFIICFQVFISYLVLRMQPLKSMMSGFLVCSIGMALTLFSQNVLFTIGAIFAFSMGEMAGSPKITEYIGRIAPADKKALYMGYSFIPVFIGNVLAGIISGVVYQNMSDKVVLTQRLVADKGLQIADGLSTNAYFEEVASQLQLTQQELTNLLWNTYSPSNLWMVLLAIGVASVVMLYIYDRVNSKA